MKINVFAQKEFFSCYQIDLKRTGRFLKIFSRSWNYYPKLADKIPSDKPRSLLGLCSIENVLRRGRLCCYSHIQYTDPVTGSKKVDKTIITGSNPRSRRRNTWLECVRNDLKLKGLEALLEKNRIAWCCSLNPKSWCGRDNKGVQHSDTGNNAC